MANRCGDEGVSDSDSECYVKVCLQSNGNFSLYCVRTFIYVGWKHEDSGRLRLSATLALRSDYKVCFKAHLGTVSGLNKRMVISKLLSTARVMYKHVKLVTFNVCRLRIHLLVCT